MISRIWARALTLPALALALTAAACGGSDGGGVTTPPATLDVVGTWTLGSVDGQSVPAAIGPSSAGLSVRSASLALRADHTYGRIDQMRSQPPGQPATDSPAMESGTWALSGTALALSPTGKAAYQMQAAAGSLTWSGGLGVWVFRR